MSLCVRSCPFLCSAFLLLFFFMVLDSRIFAKQNFPFVHPFFPQKHGFAFVFRSYYLGLLNCHFLWCGWPTCVDDIQVHIYYYNLLPTLSPLNEIELEKNNYHLLYLAEDKLFHLITRLMIQHIHIQHVVTHIHTEGATYISWLN